MEENPFHKRPSFRILILGILLGGIYVYTFIWNGGILRNLPRILFDAILLYLLIQLTVFFHAQFTLPVHTLRDRLEISSRLWLHWRNAHGPAIFVKDGREIARAGDTERRGPGLIWADTASAVVTWSRAGRKDVLGPGIHFTESGQTIGRTFSLHTQTCTLGPELNDPIFEPLIEPASEGQRKRYATLQSSRTSVSGHTRDGNEVVPSLSVVFRLDSERASGSQPGSRFGFSARAVERASRAEGIKADGSGTEEQRVAWNQLPGLMAIDLWREYLSKFTLDELFSPTFPPLPSVPQPAQPPETMDIPNTPLITRRGLAARLLRQRNNAFEKWLDQRAVGSTSQGSIQEDSSDALRPQEQAARQRTALEIIGEMVQRRMTMAAIPILDDCGRILEGHTLSPEYKKLKERGLHIEQVRISDVRFDPSVERQIIQNWNTAWLAEAENERRQVEQLERLAAQNARQSALLEHGLNLGRAIDQEKPTDINAAVKALLRAAESEIISDQGLYARATDEVQQVSNLLRWVESGQHD